MLSSSVQWASSHGHRDLKQTETTTKGAVKKSGTVKAQAADSAQQQELVVEMGSAAPIPEADAGACAGMREVRLGFRIDLG